MRIAGKGQPGVNGAEQAICTCASTFKPTAYFAAKGSDIYVTLPVWPLGSSARR